MGEVIHNKLVRDKIPEIIEADGHIPKMRILGDEEFVHELLNKLVEEAIELRDAEEKLGERADVEEVLRALDSVLGLSDGVVEEARQEKANKRGGFAKRIYLESERSND